MMVRETQLTSRSDSFESYKSLMMLPVMLTCVHHPGNHFEKLKGKLADKHSIRVNMQWRLVFTWSNKHEEARNIYLDNHKYR